MKYYSGEPHCALDELNVAFALETHALHSQLIKDEARLEREMQMLFVRYQGQLHASRCAFDLAVDRGRFLGLLSMRAGEQA